MTFFIPRDYATLFLDGATIVSMISIMLMSSEARKRGRGDDRCFFGLLVLTCILAASDALGYLFEEKSVPGSRVLCTCGMTVYFLCFILIGIVWAHYCRIRFKDRGISAGNFLRPEYLPGAVMLALIVINIFTGWIFSYDENVFYHRGVLYLLVYLVMAVYVVAGFAHLVRYRSKHSGRAVIPVWLYALPIVCGSVFTFAIPGSASFGPVGVGLSIAFTHIGTINEMLELSYKKSRKTSL